MNMFFIDGSPQTVTCDYIIKLKNVKRILDVGCGDGTLLNHLRNMRSTFELYGLEVDKRQIKKARLLKVNVIRTNIENNRFEFPKKYFDVIVCTEIIEHILDTDNLLIKIRKVLKDDGYLIISTPNMGWIYHIIRLILNHGPKTSFKAPSYHAYRGDLRDGGHVHYFTKTDLNDIFIDNGYQIVATFGTWNVNNILFRKILMISSKTLLNSILNPGIIFIVKKRRNNKNTLK